MPVLEAKNIGQNFLAVAAGEVKGLGNPPPIDHLDHFLQRVVLVYPGANRIHTQQFTIEAGAENPERCVFFKD